MKKRQLKKLENLKIALEFQQDLKDGSDRACVLFVASFLESELERLLKDKLVGDAAFKYHLFDFEGPLRTLSAKTKICYSLGFISESTMHNIAIIELLKYEFVNNYSASNFEDLLMTEKVYELTSNLYFEYEVPPRRYFCNVAFNELTLILSVYRIKSFKEKLQPTIDAVTKLESREAIAKLAEEMINEFKKDSD